MLGKSCAKESERIVVTVCVTGSAHLGKGDIEADCRPKIALAD